MASVPRIHGKPLSVRIHDPRLAAALGVVPSRRIAPSATAMLVRMPGGAILMWELEPDLAHAFGF